MDDRTDELQGLPVQVRQVRRALTNEFAGLLDLTDVSTTPQTHQGTVFLTRALAAKAVQLVAGCTTAEAANSVTDGVDDNGIDAALVASETAEIWLIQARWSDAGRARFDSAGILRLLNGLRRLVNLRYDRFNAKFDPLVDRLDAALKAPNCQIHLVLAAIGDTEISPRVETSWTKRYRNSIKCKRFLISGSLAPLTCILLCGVACFLSRYR